MTHLQKKLATLLERRLQEATGPVRYELEFGLAQAAAPSSARGALQEFQGFDNRLDSVFAGYARKFARLVHGPGLATLINQLEAQEEKVAS